MLLQCPKATIGYYRCTDPDAEEAASRACQHLRGYLFAPCHSLVCNVLIKTTEESGRDYALLIA